MIEPVKEFFSGLWENVRQLASEAWDNIKEVWNAVSGWFSETVIEPVKKFFSDMWEGIRKTAGDIWNGIKEIWGAAKSWFEEHVTGPIGKAFETAGNFIKGVFNGIIGTVEGLINGAINGINWLISQLNKISFDVPDWVPGIGGKTFGFDITPVAEVKLPRLAQGAVIPANREFLAVQGDQGGRHLFEVHLPYMFAGCYQQQ